MGLVGEFFDVNVSELRGHASTVLEIAGRVRAAGGSGESSLSGAFGPVGEFFAAAIAQAAGQVREGIGGCGQGVDDMHVGLSQASDMYERVDDTRARALALSGSEVER